MSKSQAHLTNHLHFVTCQLRLADIVKERKIQTGALLSFTCEPMFMKRHMFLGPVVLNPRRVVLLTAHHRHERDNQDEGTQCFALVAGNQLLPNLTISTQFFQELLRAGATASQIHVACLPCTCARADFHELQVHAKSAKSSHPIITPEGPRTKKSQFKLPFGLKNRRTEKSNIQERSKHVLSTLQRLKAHHKSHKKSTQTPETTTPASTTVVAPDDSGAEACAGSTSSSSSSDSEPEPIHLPDEVEKERQTIKTEAKQATYFQKEIGFIDVGNAPILKQGSKRAPAQCLHCERLRRAAGINGGTVRLAYHWHPKSPSRWIHIACCYDFICNELASHSQYPELKSAILD